ncbi:SDR family NAD(P)-dependent oxidoreductase [Desertibacillus haloalkaliphilus]|uniref:SDR family NAD(P)-dependent oxidoreductase n=1 Tax=Desertibacillus haloalkaliphilus TaxID=1328930 RepID=UPI001C2721F8|nr:SDR family oxidoreductase [Desertibacillus haloalkaliphilus]MBU8905649.1 SDR family oxidoreductase [Desertibacillus haloalkaliphilus]
MRFQGKIALVTGAGSGIGEYTAKRIASEGATVILVGRTKEKLDRVAADINETTTVGSAVSYAADVTSEKEVASLAQFVRDQYGDLHVLINNAGGSKPSAILDMSEQEWDWVQGVNLKSVFIISKLLANVMIEGAKTGDTDRAIVNVASLSGHKAGAKIPHYSSAKAGVINFSKALANELAPQGIRVNSVSPGFVETPMTERGLQNSQFEEAIKRNTALRRVGNPEEIANVIAFVGSHEATYMTGSDILVDGGWLIN